MISDKDIAELEKQISERLSAQRFSHTLGVMRSAELLGSYCLPHKIDELRAAALLHDVAKELSREEQIRLITDGGGSLTDEDMLSAPVLHSFAAPFAVKRDFPFFATEDILSAVRFHTVGDVNMSLFDEIIFLADFIEDTRSYEACIALRSELLTSLSVGEQKSNQRELHKAAIKMIDFTVKYLENKGRHVHSNMLSAKKMLECKLLNN